MTARRDWTCDLAAYRWTDPVARIDIAQNK
jgi:hypothetical protein